jgi:hypothetical protein
MPTPQSGHAELLRAIGSLRTLTVARLTANRLEPIGMDALWRCAALQATT